MIPDIIFGICPCVSHMPKFWQTCMIMYDNFMLIGEPWYCIPVDKLTKTGHKKSKRKQHVLELKSKKGFSVLLQPSPVSICDSPIISDSPSYVIKIPFSSKGHSSMKRRLLKQWKMWTLKSEEQKWFITKMQ